MMQITTVHKLQHALDAFIKGLKFVWRYAFVLASFSITIQIIYEGGLPLIEKEFLVFAIAVFLDWFKMKLKLANTNSNYHQSSSITSFTQANYWNSSIVGTPAYLSNLGRSE